MSAFCIDTRCQPMSPLVNSTVNNALLQISPDAYNHTLQTFMTFDVTQL